MIASALQLELKSTTKKHRGWPQSIRKSYTVYLLQKCLTLLYYPFVLIADIAELGKILNGLIRKLNSNVRLTPNFYPLTPKLI